MLERVLRLAESDAGWAVQLQRDYDPSLPEFLADGDRLSQATWNLVRNAIEAGAGAVTLRTRAEHGARIGEAPPGLALRLDVVDDGRGVDFAGMNVQRHIGDGGEAAEMFLQADSAERNVRISHDRPPSQPSSNDAPHLCWTIRAPSKADRAHRSAAPARSG